MVNHGRVRGLLGKLRGRVLHLQAERGALQEQLARLPEFGEGNGLLAAQVCLLLATFVVILVVFVSMMHAVVLPACQALHTRGRHCSILHAFDCREHCKAARARVGGQRRFCTCSHRTCSGSSHGGRMRLMRRTWPLLTS